MLVDERGTSSTCPSCTRRVPRPAGRTFACPHCGFTGHRDLVGGANIATRTPGGGPIQPGNPFPDQITHRRAGNHLPGASPARRDPGAPLPAAPGGPLAGRGPPHPDVGTSLAHRLRRDARIAQLHPGNRANASATRHDDSHLTARPDVLLGIRGGHVPGSPRRRRAFPAAPATLRGGGHDLRPRLLSCAAAAAVPLPPAGNRARAVSGLAREPGANGGRLYGFRWAAREAGCGPGHRTEPGPCGRLSGRGPGVTGRPHPWRGPAPSCGRAGSAMPRSRSTRYLCTRPHCQRARAAARRGGRDRRELTPGGRAAAVPAAPFSGLYF
jgi:hypothetical protein